MPASALLKVLSLLTAVGIACAAFFQASAPPQAGLYPAAIKLLAGITMTVGSLLLSFTISSTFLQSGGRTAFKALYWASLSSAGAGITEAASGLAAVNVPLSLFLASLAFAGAGMLTLHFGMGGT